MPNVPDKSTPPADERGDSISLLSRSPLMQSQDAFDDNDFDDDFDEDFEDISDAEFEQFDEPDDDVETDDIGEIDPDIDVDFNLDDVPLDDDFDALETDKSSFGDDEMLP